MPKMPCPTHEPEKYVAAAIGAGALAVAAYRYAPVIREKLGALLARAGAPGAKSKPAPSAINRKDYTPPPFSVGSVYLDFDLHDSCTIVLCKMELRRAAGAPDAPLVLHGEDLELLRVAIDGRHLDEKEYTIADNMLTVHSVPDAFTFMSEVRLRPQDNTQLSGLYRTNGVFCSQCEAEVGASPGPRTPTQRSECPPRLSPSRAPAQGFRRITYMFDRPDVMTTYRVRVEAEKAACPVLLSNGNRLATGEACTPSPTQSPRRPCLSPRAVSLAAGARQPSLGAVGRPLPQTVVPLLPGGGRPRVDPRHVHDVVGQGGAARLLL